MTGLEHWGFVQTAHLKFPPTGKSSGTSGSYRCESNLSVGFILQSRCLGDVSDTAKQADRADWKTSHFSKTPVVPK